MIRCPDFPICLYNFRLLHGESLSLPSILAGRLALPVIGAPMFIVSTPDLVIAQCKAGVVGSFPSLNARPAEMLEEWLKLIEQELARHDAENPAQRSAPFAVNLIVHKSNGRLLEDLQMCVKYKVPIVITSDRKSTRLNSNHQIISY